MRWVASIIWALVASLTTNGFIAFVMGGLDHTWVIVVVNLIWLTIFSTRLPYDLRHLQPPFSSRLALFVDAFNLSLSPGDRIFGRRSCDRLGIHIGDDVVVDNDLRLRIWGSRPGVQMRILPNRFKWLVFRINAPDWMSLKFRKMG